MTPRSTSDAEVFSKRLARLVQRTLLRGRCPNCRFADMAVRYLPYEEVGGDFYDFTLVETGQPAFLVGDISGHGMAAALVTAWILGCVRKSKAEHPRPPDLIGDLRRLIDELAEGLDDDAPSCSAFHGVYDPESRLLSYCNAGHPSPLLMDQSGQVVHFLESQCLLIAAMSGPRFVGQERHVEITPGSRLVLYTDGLIDVFNADGQQWGTPRLAECLADCRALPAEEAADAAIEAAKRFSSSGGFGDDVTVIILDFP